MYMHVHILISLGYLYSNLLFFFSTDICSARWGEFLYYHVMGIFLKTFSASIIYPSREDSMHNPMLSRVRKGNMTKASIKVYNNRKKFTTWTLQVGSTAYSHCKSIIVRSRCKSIIVKVVQVSIFHELKGSVERSTIIIRRLCHSWGYGLVCLLLLHHFISL